MLCLCPVCLLAVAAAAAAAAVAVAGGVLTGDEMMMGVLMVVGEGEREDVVLACLLVLVGVVREVEEVGSVCTRV